MDHFGFARVRCEEYGHEYLLAFSCKRRHFCPSCHQKRITEAIYSGASKSKACKELGISHKTYNRWTLNGTVKVDGRPGAVRPEPANKFSDEERNCILEVCNTNDFASLPPTQIVPILADRGVYIGSESTIYRVLRESEQQHHRGRTLLLHKKNSYLDESFFLNHSFSPYSSIKHSGQIPWLNFAWECFSM